MGAAGRDFHNFNVYFRDNENYNVVAFTATQIPDIAGRKYPAKLCGKLYPNGIPIYPEEDLKKLIKEHNIDLVVFAYSDIPNSYVMEKAAIVNATGANFVLMGTKDTMIQSSKPVIAVCAVRTGCGKSQVSRKLFTLPMISFRHVRPLKHTKKDLRSWEVKLFKFFGYPWAIPIWPFIPQLKTDKADAIFVRIWGASAVRFIKQWVEYGKKWGRMEAALSG
jgi:hypothetical protein